MNRKLSICIVTALALALSAFWAGTWIKAAADPSQNAGDSIQALKARVGKLELQVLELQAQVRNLATKPSPRVLTIPEPRGFSGDRMPPGSTEHEFNGMKYWIIPIKDK